ncbi:hypothetical protein CFII64_24579 [Pseudomonas sp. CFII64]|nr:hypothetical protein CFII64_24579 [Pseudomonas sp. CFII64]
MSDEQRAELASCKSFTELHERLSAQPIADPADAAQASVGCKKPRCLALMQAGGCA